MIILTALAAFLASVLSGVAGFGGAMVFLPLIVAVYGARASVPIVTISVLLGNASRVFFYRRHLNLKIVGLFLLGSIPFSLLGSVVYVSLPAYWIKRAIGLFLVLSVAYQRLYRPFRLKRAWLFTPLGAVSGFLSAIIGAIGPVAAPFFLSYGLVKEAYVGSEAFCAAGTHLAKSFAYHQLNVLGPKELGLGLGFGAVMSAGSYVAKHILERLPRESFLLLVEGLMVLIGLCMLVQGRA